MHRFHSLIAAIAVVAVSAGIAVAHSLPAASDAGIATAQAASKHAVPMWGIPEGPSIDNPANQNEPSSDTHGATVSEAASNPTPDGDWANHGDYVSSIATGWGARISAGHSQAASHDAQGLSHKP